MLGAKSRRGKDRQGKVRGKWIARVVCDKGGGQWGKSGMEKIVDKGKGG